MIIISVNGGLGNQLQQYALYEKMKTLGKEVKLDLSWYESVHKQAIDRELELSRFPNIELEACTEQEYNQLLGKRDVFHKFVNRVLPFYNPIYTESKMFDPSIYNFTNKYLEGYWACEYYYADILPQLRKTLQFPAATSQKTIEIAKQMKEEESVSIHIRRADYLNFENISVFGGICTEAYYECAKKTILQRYPDAHFYIFSDDTEYALQHYSGEKYTVIDWNKGEDSIFDMYLMSQCRHNICANSTFSFWGARLNDNLHKIMIRPLKQKNTMEYPPEQMMKLWKKWLLVDEMGTLVNN